MMNTFRNLSSQIFRSYSSSTNPKTGILMMNMGGPQKSENVYDFLLNLFSDREIIKLPFQKYLAPIIAKRRTPKIQDQYNQIGGGSPITKWTDIQGAAMTQILDKISPETAPHKHYIGFRYVPPFTRDAIQQMHKDGVERAVAFSQYPQFSCTTTGSSVNELSRLLVDTDSQLVWSLLDRWPVQPNLIAAWAQHIRAEIGRIPVDERRDCVLLFSAHSIPLEVVDRGDPYPHEVAATVYRVMEELQFEWPYRLVWQSKVGPKKWLGPHTDEAMRGFARPGNARRALMLVPVAFTSDHIETLYELDIEYCQHLAAELGLAHVYRAAAMNDNPLFIRGLAELVRGHLRVGETSSRQYTLRCPGCTNPACANSRGMFRMLQNDLGCWTDRVFEQDAQTQRSRVQAI